eukprot:7315256-Lingulodinium_polyedra.AAC.1
MLTSGLHGAPRGVEATPRQSQQRRGPAKLAANPGREAPRPFSGLLAKGVAGREAGQHLPPAQHHETR